jgi:integrase/recombinase XerC
MRAKVISATPMSKIIAPKAGQRLPEVVQEHQLRKVIIPSEGKTEFELVRNGLIVEVLYVTGMRVSELANLKDSDFDFRNQSIRVLGKGNKERLIPFTHQLAASVKEYQKLRNRELEKNPEGYLFLTASGRQIYARLVHQIVSEALQGITTLSKRSPHVLRHTFATHLLNNGAEINAIKELLGHASLAATQVYTHNTIDKLKETYKKSHPRA